MRTLIIFVVSVMMTLASFAQVPADAGAITGNTNVCANSTAVYSVGAITNATSYMWVVPGGATITSGYGTNVIIVQFGTSSGDIVVFGQNGSILGNGSSLHVTVNQAPSISVVASPTDICAGATTTLTATGTGIASFVWSGSSMTTSSVTVNPTTPTTYTVTVTGTNTCTSSASVTVNVHTAPNVTLNLTEDHACTDVNSVLLAGGFPTGGTYSCATPNVVFGGTTIHPPIVGPGTWNVTYTVTDMYGCSASADDLFTVYPIPAVMFNNISGSPLTTGSTPVDLVNFVMPIGGTFTGPGISGTLFDPKVAGVGTHMLTYTYAHPISGCEATQIQYVNVGSVGIDEVNVAVENISMFPNPATDQLNLSGIDQKEIVSLEIKDMIGKTVYTADVTSASMIINVNDFHSGIYFISFVSADGISVSKKFIKTE